MTSRPRPHGGDEPDEGRPSPRGRGEDPSNVADAHAEVEAAGLRGRVGAERGSAPPPPSSSDGPPWPAAASVAGSARGADLNPPHRRHTVTGARNGMVQEDNTVYLRGYEGVATDDVQGIAAGRAVWNQETQRYEINGRSYGVEPNGTVFPDSGTGMVKLDRNEYAALKEIVRAGGDLSASPQLSRNPRFTENPDAVAKAKAIYDGTYVP
ncbi:hypothetical protein Ade02nite_25310 [Paractinoplanes deccanensis]|uniref:Uncharacterized protein n=1 Tax=Paractinoplanes deccanensis TaxID=113561 RepID=A0ABQ3Y1Z9_9ACTN|nr:hypothetical protein [Actinoplanes deccanensis]GID73890.1 hypothetical protein Ade02nite_25310 [Actinoplanes deccanensis]